MSTLWWMLLFSALAQAPEVDDASAPVGASAPADDARLPPLSWSAPPRAGEETVLTLVDAQERAIPGATVQVVHRKGLGGERQRAIGITDSRGRVRWTPEIAGAAEVRAGEVRRVVGVQWPSAPSSAVALLVLVLLAGAGFAGYGWTPRTSRRRGDS